MNKLLHLQLNSIFERLSEPYYIGRDKNGHLDDWATNPVVDNAKDEFRNILNTILYVSEDVVNNNNYEPENYFINEFEMKPEYIEILKGYNPSFKIDEGGEYTVFLNFIKQFNINCNFELSLKLKEQLEPHIFMNSFLTTTERKYFKHVIFSYTDYVFWCKLLDKDINSLYLYKMLNIETNDILRVYKLEQFIEESFDNNLPKDPLYSLVERLNDRLYYYEYESFLVYKMLYDYILDKEESEECPNFIKWVKLASEHFNNKK